jgi:hypothetical protein
MKSNSSEAPSSGDMPASLTEVVEKRSRRTLAEAASELARAMIEGTLGGSPLGRGGRSPSANSAAASVHRLRKVIERDRANFAAQEPETPEASAVALSDPDEDVTALDPERLDEPVRVCKTCGARELPVAARMQRPRALRCIPPPPPPRRASVVEFVVEEQDEGDESLSVHDEPTRVRRPPAIMDRLDGRASALAAAAASAFGVDVSH